MMPFGFTDDAAMLVTALRMVAAICDPSTAKPRGARWPAASLTALIATSMAMAKSRPARQILPAIAQAVEQGGRPLIGRGVSMKPRRFAHACLRRARTGSMRCIFSA